MSWITVIWSMVASACLTLATVHLLVWCSKRTAWANLLFSLMAAATAGLAGCEIWMMWARTPEQFAAAMRWLHVPGLAIILAMVGFVLVYLRAGRLWLAWTICGLRTLSLLLNFLVGQNLNYREVTALRHVPFLGESVAVAEGVSNPWMLVGQLSLLLLVVFVADAAITAWRRGDRQRALATGGSIGFCALAAMIQAVLVNWGIVHWPVTVSLFFMPIVVAMGYEMSRDVVRAAQLSDDLRESEERMTLAAEAAGVGVWMWNIAGNQVWGSERWLQLFGFAPGAAVSFENVIQRIHPNDREMVEHGVRQALTDRGDYVVDYRVVLPDGAQRWVVARGRVHSDAKGRPARMMGVTIDITYRKRTESALAESELRYRALFEAAPEGIVLIGADGHIRAANAAQARLYGYESPQQLEGFYAPLCVAESDREQSLRNMRELLSGEERPVRHYNAVRRDGSEFSVEVTSAILRGPDQKVQGYLCLTRDITEHKQAQAALRESEARFRGMADTAPVLIWMAGTDKRCNFFNKGWLDFTGRALEQELGDGWTEGVHPDDLAGCVKHYVESFDARRPFTMEYRLRRHDGQYRWISDTGVPRYDPERVFLGYIGSCVDFTDRKRADEKFHLAVEASPNGIVLMNSEGRIMLVNAETEKLSGYSRGELIGQPVEMLVPERFRGGHSGHRTGFFAAPQARAMGAGRELSARRKNGTEFPVEIGLSPIQSSEGILVLTVIVDITARKLAEAETRRQREELAHLSRVTMLGELSGSLAHELNQPLGAILRNAEAAELFLQDPSPDLEELRAILVDIRRDDQRAGAVIQRMRSLIKRREVERSLFDPNLLATDVISLVHSDASSRKVRLVFEPVSTLPPVRGDRVQLQQVMLNLLLNAMDAVNNSAPQSRLVSMHLQTTGTQVEVTVSDTGHGIPADKFAHVFEPFFTTKPNGMGMGLPISRSIVEAHGGQLWAENNPAGGATFRFTLPADDPVPDPGENI